MRALQVERVPAPSSVERYCFRGLVLDISGTAARDGGLDDRQLNGAVLRIVGVRIAAGSYLAADDGIGMATGDSLVVDNQRVFSKGHLAVDHHRAQHTIQRIIGIPNVDGVKAAAHLQSCGHSG